MSDRSWSTSLHEAGHAVVGLLFGMDLVCAEVRRHGGGGVCCFAPNMKRSGFAYACMCLSGGLAANGNPSETDRKHVHHALGNDADQARYARRVASFMVREYRAAIEHVASHLQTKSKLFGYEIAEILEAHRDRPLPRKAVKTIEVDMEDDETEIERSFRLAQERQPYFDRQCDELGI